MHKYSANLYANLKHECEVHICSVIDALQSRAVEHKYANDHAAYLALVDAFFVEHCEQFNTIRNIFLYLDRVYTHSTPGALSIWDMGLSLVQQRLVLRNEILENVFLSLLLLIEQERNGNLIDQSILKNATQMLYALDLYKAFEKIFLDDSVRYFKSLSTQHFNDALQYFSSVEQRIHQANEMVDNYLHVSTRIPLIRIIETQYLVPSIDQYLAHVLPLCIDSTLDTNHIKKTDLKRVYLLCDRIGYLPQLNKVFSDYIKLTGLSYINSEDTIGSKHIIENILLFHDNCDIVVKQSFCTNEIFKQSLKSSFEYFINFKSSNKIARLLVLYLDVKLRSEKAITEDEVETCLQKSMIIFRVLNEKDTFEAFYKKYLSKRLLLGKSANYDTEKYLISMLKTECGTNYTAKLEGMFTDMDLSKDIMATYAAHVQAVSSHSPSSAPPGSPALDGSGGIDFSVQVLSSGYWTNQPASELRIPSSLASHISAFDSFYVEKYQGRRLQWTHSLDKCIVVARFPKGRKELEVSFHQAIVLQCFNLDSATLEDKSLTLSDVVLATGVDSLELRRVLLSLACGELGTRVLTKEPKSREVNDTDVFRFNAEFTSKLFRVRIKSIALKETEAEVERTNEEVFRDRQYAVDANIVRIMKTRKQLAHNVLIGEILSQLKFPVSNADVKKRIESLIERDYMERDKNDSSLYRYLA